MFDTQFPWQPAVLVYLTYICAVCTQTRSNHLLLSRRAEAGEEPERLLNEPMRDDSAVSRKAVNKLCPVMAGSRTGTRRLSMFTVAEFQFDTNTV